MITGIGSEPRTTVGPLPRGAAGETQLGYFLPRRPADLAELREALYVVHLLAEHPDHHMLRARNRGALYWLRRMITVELHVQRGEALLADLRRKAGRAVEIAT